MGAIQMSKQIINEEVATEQAGIMLDYYDIDPEDLPEDQQKVVETYTRKLIKAIMKGRVEIKEVDGKPAITQFTDGGSTIEYGVLSGKAREETSKVKDNNHYGKIFAMLGSMGNVGKDGISALEGPDLTTAEALGMLFLQA
jgi:hypothetical protein